VISQLSCKKLQFGQLANGKLDGFLRLQQSANTGYFLADPSAEATLKKRL